MNLRARLAAAWQRLKVEWERRQAHAGYLASLDPEALAIHRQRAAHVAAWRVWRAGLERQAAPRPRRQHRSFGQAPQEDDRPVTRVWFDASVESGREHYPRGRPPLIGEPFSLNRDETRR